jgi:hydroxymethylpyrimidine/phosphomethylpyrimidine kinase / thiaminase
VLEDIPPMALKTGMLTDARVIRATVETLKSFYTTHTSVSPQSEVAGTPLSTLPPLVVDPVTVSTSGHTLLPSDAIEGLLKDLIPMATIITPNIQEARLLLSHIKGTGPAAQEIKSVVDMIAAARELTRESGVSSALVKGGHLVFKAEDLRTGIQEVERGNIEWTEECDPDGVEVLRVTREAREGSIWKASAEQDLVVDVLYCAEYLRSQIGSQERSNGYTFFVRPRIQSTSTHGTGCTLSAAIACHLARGVPGMSGPNRSYRSFC